MRGRFFQENLSLIHDIVSDYQNTCLSGVEMGSEGFEPSKALPSDLQSDPFDRSGNPPPSFT